MRAITPGLYLGSVEASYNRDMLQANCIAAIVSLTSARWVWWNGTARNAGIPEQRHKWVQCVDSSTQDLLVYMNNIWDFIERMASLLESSDKPHPGAILIHCALGISRSPTIIIAYLMRKYSAKREEVLAFVGYQVWEDEERTMPKAPYQAFLDDRAALLKRKGLTGNEPLAPQSLSSTIRWV
ncbi:protein-tyrosine phosphatase-like protein [Aspergillus bertholletiae]|uniref:protein-tyrosine-phosphatase n=1 Tax=Aspergillus bertholletiae TaxID=1226010 RepID=A0A5N7B3H1_9EURO|nr:protein-tyrosine phosphatase-like protein [Aspergillus bertholletiae]